MRRSPGAAENQRRNDPHPLPAEPFEGICLQWCPLINSPAGGFWAVGPGQKLAPKHYKQRLKSKRADGGTNRQPWDRPPDMVHAGSPE